MSIFRHGCAADASPPVDGGEFFFAFFGFISTREWAQIVMRSIHRHSASYMKLVAKFHQNRVFGSSDNDWGIFRLTHRLQQTLIERINKLTG